MSTLSQHISIIIAFALGSLSPLLAEEEAPKDPGLRETYILRPNDVVALSVYEEPDLATSTAIVKSGEASFPLIGAVKLAGLDLVSASQKIRALYAADYLRYPRIILSVTEYALDYVEVIGMVRTPGKVPLSELNNLDIRTAIANAGGLTELADRENIEHRTKEGVIKKYSFDFVKSNGSTVILKHGDQVYVGESPFAGKQVLASGEVIKPGLISIPNDGVLYLSVALARAGGLTAEADKSVIRLIRKDGTASSYSYDAIESGAAGKIPLNGGDRIDVAQSKFLGAMISVLGQVKKPGLIKFPLDGRLDIFRAIAMAGGPTEIANLKKVIIRRQGQRPIEINLVKLREGDNLQVWLLPDDEIKVSESWF